MITAMENLEIEPKPAGQVAVEVAASVHTVEQAENTLLKYLDRQSRATHEEQWWLHQTVIEALEARIIELSK